MQINRLFTTIGAAIVLAFAFASGAQAQTTTITWIGATGNFYSFTNWDSGTVPGVTNIAVINNAGTATIEASSGTNDLSAIQLGDVEGGTESGHVIMNGGFWNLGGTAGDPKAVIGLSTTLSTFIMNGGTIYFDGPDQFPGSSTDDGLNGLDWEVGEKGLGRFEMHSNAVFRAGDDLKVGANALGNGSVLIDGNAWLSVGSGVSVSEGGPNTNEQVMIVAGNARVDAGNSMGAGNPLGSTDEGYLTMASAIDSTGRLVVQDDAVFNFRRLSARQGNSIILVKNRGQMHIFDVLNGTGGSPANRPTETGPNSTLSSVAPSTGSITLQDDAVMTVNSDPASGPTKGLAISGPRDAGNAGGTAILIVRDRASFTVLQDLALGTGADVTSDGTLEVVGPNAAVNIGGNLAMAVDLNGDATLGKGTLTATITGPTHSTVSVTNLAQITNGFLNVKLSGYSPVGGESYTLIKAGSFNGQFLGTDFTGAPLASGLSWQLQYTPTTVVLSVTGSPTGPKTIVVTTTNSTVVAGQTNLTQAIQLLENGDTIGFNIPGAGPHYIATPAGGYPLITVNNVTIDGYTQPGAVANSNPILSSNNAVIKVVLDSRNGNSKIMDFAGDTPNDDTGYGSGESAILGVLSATNVTVRGVAMLAVPLTGPAVDVAVYGVSFAKGANGHIAGCWIGVDPATGKTAPFIAPADGVTGFRYRGRDGDNNNAVTNTILVSGVTIGVGKTSSNPRSEFNIITGVPAIPVILEGENHRFSGNFFGVLPDGNTDFNVALDPALAGFFEGFIEVGRAGNNVVIGVDGDGVNDAEERNVFGGTMPPSLGGYDHSLEFYGQTPGTNVVVAGNYIGVGVDGTTRFTNGVPPFNAPSGSATYRFGSDFDGVSDALEGNVVFNNWPQNVFDPNGDDFVAAFFDELDVNGNITARGNRLVNNFTPPAKSLTDLISTFTFDYYSRALDTNNGIMPVLSTNSTVSRLIGTVPLPTVAYSNVLVDVYVPDPEGITNGIAAAIPELPDGFIQGKTYLGSFVADGAGDLNPAAGAFEFDISGLSVPLNTPLTVAATYSKSPPATHNAIGVTTLFAIPVLPKQAILVTTTNSSGPGSLLTALTGVQTGDTIGFNIPGAGPHYIATPAGGYPLITVNNVTIDGYTQPGAVANSNPILSSNNAVIKVVLDSRNGNSKIMDFAGDTPNDDTGYGSGESAILGVLSATNVTVRGVAMLAVPLTGPAVDVAVYGVSFAKGANGHIAGCWIGVDPATGKTAPFIAPADGVTGFRYRGRDGDNNNAVTNTILVSGVTIGVGKTSSNPRSEFNIITGVPAIPVILEGENHRFSGNFFGVLPDGNTDFNVALDPALAGFFEGFIEVGRAGNNVVIGVDGDGVNDAEERNVFGGTMPPSLGGYDHSLEFYGQTPGTNVVVAGNYIGVGVDGTTRFTNGVPPFNAPSGSATYRFGSDFDGVSDALEGNVVFNNWPQNVFDPNGDDFVAAFFDELDVNGNITARGNRLVNNFTPPAKSLTDLISTFTFDYYSRALDTNNGIMPVLSTNSTVSRLIGTVPLPTVAYSNVLVDVYVPDPEGITNGIAAAIPELPDGFIQGKTYLGSFVADGAGDLNPAAGAFEFDISGLSVPLNTPLTVAATYSKSPPATHNAIGVTTLFAIPVQVKAGSTPPAITSVTINGSNLVINWTGGTAPYQVQKRANFNTGTLWVAEGAPTATTTATIPITGGQSYFQVLGQ